MYQSERVAHPHPKRVIVIGAGIVGVCCALHLQMDGHEVTLVERGEPGKGASYGNAGIIVHGASMPVALKGMWRDIPKLILGTQPYFRIRWPYLPVILPWALRLLSESREKKMETNAAALATLSGHAKPAWHHLVDQTKTWNLIGSKGWLKVYKTKKAFDSTLTLRSIYDQNGGIYQILNSDEIRQMEPVIAPIFDWALYFPEFDSILNPFRLVQKFLAHFLDRGGKLFCGEVKDFELTNRPLGVKTNNGLVLGDVIVLAAGAWSKSLALKTGDDVPLGTERGYHFMLPKMCPGPTRPLMYGDFGFAISPMEDGIRLAHGVELANLSASPNNGWIRRLLPHAKEMLPDLNIREDSHWLGFRPTLPDSRPIIGQSTQFSDVYFAFGHQHYGMSLGPITGRIISDLVARRDPHIDLTPFKPGRWTF